MKRLFLILIISFIIGIYIAYELEVNMEVVIILFTILALMLLFSFIFNRFYVLVLIILFIFIGIIMSKNDFNSKLLYFIGKDIILEGIIESRDIINRDKSTYIVKVNYILNDEKTYRLADKVLLNYYGNDVLDISDKVRIRGTLELPRENTNPGLFNYRLYLKTKGIYAVINTYSNSVSIISKGKLDQAQLLRYKFQGEISKILDKTLNEKNSKIMKSIILGDSGILDDETNMRFRELGLSHILAVSGLHIGVIYLLIFRGLRLLSIDRRYSITFALVIIWIYGFLIGFPVSVLRSSIMFSILSLSTLVYRRYDSINTLSFAGFILLLIRPLWIFDVGFQLSFIATASIIIFTPRIKWLLSIYSKRASKILSSLLAVQIGLFPILAYHYNTYAVLSILSNLILVPIFSFSLIICFLIILISFVFTNAGIVFGFIVNSILNIADVIMDFFFRFSFININLPSLRLTYILLFYFLLLVILRVINIDLFNSKINKVIFYYFAIVLVASIFMVYTYNATTLEFIDVGQGDSCLVSTKDKVFLIDTGGTSFGDFDVGGRIVLPYLLKKGINKLDGVFITHFHEDHAEGLLSLMDGIIIDNIFIGYENPRSNLFTEIINKAKAKNIRITKISEGDLIYIDDNNLIKVLNPFNNISSQDIDNENNLSLTFILNSYGKNTLFTGDIEKEVEQKLVSKYNLENVDIIKVPHHGSITSSSAEFVSEIRPTYVVIQVGKNSFGHPHNEVLERYKNVGASILRNDENGLIAFNITENNVETYTYIKAKLTFNDIILNYRYDLLYIFVYIFISLVFCIIYCNEDFYLQYRIV
mgnify:CR=1 FL=1